MKFKVIGAGLTGSKIASTYTRDAMLISTADQDTASLSAFNVITFGHDGAGKKFSNGEKIWEAEKDKLGLIIKGIEEENVLIFAGFGGGSGSSCTKYLVQACLDNGKHPFVVGILPFRKENNPPLANAVQSVGSLLPYIDQCSVFLVDNEKMLKKFKHDWNKINEHIIFNVKEMFNLLEASDKYYSPTTIDDSELESVLFGGGFVDMSYTFLEDTNAKFDYGKMDAETKNCLIAITAEAGMTNRAVDSLHSKLTEQVNKYATKVKNARMIPGIVRTSNKAYNSNSYGYMTIISGINPDHCLKQISKMRDKAIEKAQAFNAKRDKVSLGSKKEMNLLDI